jgi:hypothetical protein
MVGRFRVIIGMLLALLLVSGCATTTLVRPQPTPLPTSTAQPPNPFPLTAPLAPPPTTCPTAPPVQHIDFTQFGSFSGPVRFFGAAPVWIPNEFFPHGTIHLESRSLEAIDYPGLKILWEVQVGSNGMPSVNVRVTNLSTGVLGWWGTGNHYVNTVVFHIQGGIDHGEVDTGWHEWGSLLSIPAAGCYALDVSWASGSWRTIFAAGR